MKPSKRSAQRERFTRRERFDINRRGSLNEIRDLAESLQGQAWVFNACAKDGLFDGAVNRGFMDAARQLVRTANGLRKLLKLVARAKYEDALETARRKNSRGHRAALAAVVAEAA